MQWGVSFVVLLLEFWVLHTSAIHQYQWVNLFMNWTDAQNYCREHFVDLATVDSQEDMERLYNQTEGKADDYFWLGLKRYKGDSSWKWSLAGRQFYGEGETDYRNWVSPGPSNQSCTALVSNETGAWRDYPCGNTYSFVCFQSGGESGHHRYILVVGPRTWIDAQTYCRQNYRDLASVRNQADNEEIQRLVLNQTGSAMVWIGLFKDDYKWSDQSYSSFRYWDPSWRMDGNDDCGLLNYITGRRVWITHPCDHQHPFVCHNGTNTTISKKPANSKQVVRVELVCDSPLTLEDPEVQSSILQQIGASPGIPENSRLRWKRQEDGKVFHRKQEEKEEEQTGSGGTCH